MKSTEHELIEKNALLEKSAMLINNSPDILGVIDAVTLRIEEVNQAFTRILGFSYEEAKDTVLSVYLDEQDYGRLQQLNKNENEKFSFESRAHCKNGSVKLLDWHVVVKDNKWFVNARDITQMRQAEKICNYFAAVVKQSSDAIYVHDHEGKISSWNAAAERIYGYPEREALQMKIWKIIPESLKPGVQEIVTTLLQGGKIESLETKRLTKHGALVDVLFSASIIGEPGTADNSIVITERDVTPLKVADEQIRQLNKALAKNAVKLEAVNKELESFSYSVSHDLRAPLRALHGNAEILEEDYGDVLTEDAKKIIGKIHGNVNRMNGLINDLLSFVKIGKKEVRKSVVNMEELVHHVFAEISQTNPHEAEITIGGLPEALADHSMLTQVWINLISNAIKFSAKKESARIEVGSRDVDGGVEYFIKDNGAGFDMAYAGKLFGTFQRLHDVTEFEGTGIGLAIVKRILVRHGGTIRAEAAPEQGATFYFTLPEETEASPSSKPSS